MRFISLLKITADQRPADPYNEGEDEGEGQGEVETVGPVTAPCVVNVAAIRCFYPRKDDRPGTRLTFTDGGGFAVLDGFATVRALVEGIEPEPQAAAA